MKTSKIPLPTLALVVGVLSLSFSGIFIRWSGAPGMVTSFYRMTFASLILAPFALPQTLQTVQKSSIKWTSLLFFPFLGGLFSALDHGTWGTALDFTRLANATLMNNMAPIWVAAFALIFLRESLTGKFWLGLALTMSGATVVLGNSLLSNPTLSFGDILGIISSLFYAGYYLASQRGRQHFAALPYLWMITLGSAIFLLVGILFFGQPLTGYPPEAYLVFLMAAVVSQIFGHFSLTYALGHLPASIVSPTMIAQPVLTSLLGIWLVGENIGFLQALGGLAVLAGIYLVNTARKSR